MTTNRGYMMDHEQSDLGDLLRSGFMTFVSADGEYYIKVAFRERKPAQDLHRSLALQQSRK